LSVVESKGSADSSLSRFELAAKRKSESPAKERQCNALRDTKKDGGNTPAIPRYLSKKESGTNFAQEIKVEMICSHHLRT